MTIPGEPKWAIRSYSAARWQRRLDASDLALFWIVAWSGMAFRGRANQRSRPGRPKR